MADPITQPRWQRRPDDRPEEILDAAMDVFGEVGFARAKLDLVAKRAGVSKGTLYLYFDSKEALFREMVRAKVVTHVVFGETLLTQSQASAREILEQFIRRWWEIARQPDMAQLCRLVHSEISNFPELARFFTDEVIARTRRLMTAIFRLGVAQGEFRSVPNDFPCWAVASLVVHGAMRQRFFAPHDPEALSDDQVVDGIVDLIYRSVALPGRAEPE
jgi:AcrR family transcriptional regulator